MGGKPIAYVMEQTLGNTTHYLNLRREETVLPGEPLQWLPIEFRKTRLPWAVSGSLLARRAIASVMAEVDGFFIHTITLSLLAPDLFRRKPTVLSTDGTPLNKRAMRGAYGLKSEGRVLGGVKRALYSAVFRQAAGFVAWSSWAKQSLVEDYGCPEGEVAVIPPGIDLEAFAPGDRGHEVPRILFVGGDFERKGGDLLLKVFRGRLRGRAELNLVTRAAVPEEAGVRVFNHEAANSPTLRELYATCDIFALPTRADCYSVACVEALAAGMPIVATRVGGIPDIVREDVTGLLVDQDDEARLGDALEAFVGDRDRLRAMASHCRADAAARFESRTNARRLFEFVRSRCSAVKPA